MAITLLLLAMFSADTGAQVAHPTMRLDGGLEIFLYEVDFKLRSETDDVRESRKTLIEAWKKDRTIVDVEYTDSSVDVVVGPAFSGRTHDGKLYVARVIASYGRWLLPTRRILFFMNAQHQILYKYTLDSDLLRPAAFQ